MATGNQVPKLYKSVIDDVITNVREAFLDDGVDEQVLHELKQLWQKKLLLSKAVDFDSKDEHGHLMPARKAQIAQPPTAHHHHHQPKQAQPIPAAQAQGAPGLPAFNQSTGQFELSSAAATAQGALQNFLPGSTVTIQTPQGPMQFLIQPQVNQQLQQHAQMQQQQALSMTIPTTVDPQQLSRGGQLDGTNDSSSDDDDDDDDNDKDDDDDDDDENKEDDGAEEEPLNSNDDVSDDESAELFETDNVVVCQFDKIHRNKNRWKFYLKDGIMNLQGKDYVFQKSNGDAEW